MRTMKKKSNRDTVTMDDHHIYTNGEGQRYISATQLIGKYKKPFNKSFWLRFKAYEEYFDNIPANEKQLEYLNRKYESVGWKAKEETTLWKVLKTWNMADKPDEALIFQKCEELAKEHGLAIDVVEEAKKIEQLWKSKSNTALDRGNAIHDKKDAFIRDKHNVDYDWSLYDITYPNLDVGTYSEMSISDDEFKIAGTVDYLRVLNDGKRLFIKDYKTNKKLSFSSFHNKFTNEKEKMLYPLDDLDNCDFVHYTLQLSLYGYLMERKGYVVDKLQIQHEKYNKELDKNVPVKYDIVYIPQTIEKMINHYISCQNK